MEEDGNADAHGGQNDEREGPAAGAPRPLASGDRGREMRGLAMLRAYPQTRTIARNGMLRASMLWGQLEHGQEAILTMLSCGYSGDGDRGRKVGGALHDGTNFGGKRPGQTEWVRLAVS